MYWMILNKYGKIEQIGKASKTTQSGMPRLYYTKKECLEYCDLLEQPVKVEIAIYRQQKEGK